MYRDVADTYLFQELVERGRNDLNAKVLDLRRRLGAYLAASRETFPHYTSHAVDHSDEIVRSISSIAESGVGGSALPMTDAEIYLCLMSAYLHDAGMVVSDEEKVRALGSREWQYFLRAQDSRASEHQRIQDLRGAADAADDDALRYQADLSLRLLIAEYFRSLHAGRAQLVINEALTVGRDYLEADPVAINSLVAICVGHGLSRTDLADPRTYPTRRTLFGDEVNVRLLSVLLRIGDLLDMRFDRACPLMANIASPLPPESAAHWAQYGDITDRLISGDEIRIFATCRHVEEHRLLRDWCQWLSDEIADAPRLLVGSPRHGSWRPPVASLDGPQPTIHIARAQGATYRVIDWRFELDRNEVLLRLVHDANPRPLGFVQELVQNALDATRTLAATEPAASTDRRVVVDLATNDDGDIGAIAVSDSGIGMTETIIERYLLQVGRSWYRSAEFKVKYSFEPTSRFGVGFMSCFADSDMVVVTTRHAGAPAGQAIRLQIPGPRNYLVAEDWARELPGTTVEVMLRSPCPPRQVVDLLRAFCRANEHPIEVRIDGVAEERLPHADRIDWLQTPLGDAVVERRLVSWEEDGVTGEARFFVVAESDGSERWDEKSYVLSNQLVVPVYLGPSWLALNGLQHDSASSRPLASSEVSVRVDVRRHVPDVGLSRDQVSLRDFVRPLEEAIEAHLESVPLTEYRYRERVARKFQTHCSEGWCNRVPATRRVFSQDGVQYLSEIEVLSFDRIGMLWVDAQDHALLEAYEVLEDEQIALASQCDRPTLTGGDLRHGVGLGLALNIQQDYEPVGFRRLSSFSGGRHGWSLDLSPHASTRTDPLYRLSLSKTVPFDGGSQRLVGLKTPLFFSMVLWNAECPVIHDLDAALSGRDDVAISLNTKLPSVFNKTEEGVVAYWTEMLAHAAEKTDSEAVARWSKQVYRYDAETYSLWLVDDPDS